MDYTKILKRSWHNVWHYRALWIFGLILALTTVSLEGAVWYRGRDWEELPEEVIQLNLPRGYVVTIPVQIRLDDVTRFERIIVNYKHQLDSYPRQPGEIVINYDPPADLSVEAMWMNRQGKPHVRTFRVLPEVADAGITLAFALAGALALLFVMSRVLRYVSEAALLRMVDDYEKTGKRCTRRQGWRLGWSRSAWRIFSINWAVNLPAGLALLCLLLVVGLPLVVWVRPGNMVRALGTGVSLAFLLMWIALAMVIGPILAVLKRFSWRAAALERRGVAASMRRGLAMMRQYPKEAVLTWLIMALLGLAWPLLMAPAALLLAALGLAAGAVSTLVVGGVAWVVWHEATRWVVAALLVGIPTFLLVLGLPLAFLGGLRKVFQSSTWTLTYRELRAKESVQPGPSLEFDGAGLEPAPSA